MMPEYKAVIFLNKIKRFGVIMEPQCHFSEAKPQLLSINYISHAAETYTCML
jgi:hypothetical protein